MYVSLLPKAAESSSERSSRHNNTAPTAARYLAIQIKRVVHFDYTTTARQRHLIGDSENRARRCYYVVLKAGEINSGRYKYFFFSLKPCASLAVCDWSWRCTPQVWSSNLAGSIKFF